MRFPSMRTADESATHHAAAVCDRNRKLLRLARELGAQHFDPSENLVRLDRADLPQYRGLAVGHTSLEYAISLLETEGDARLASRIIHRILDCQVRDETNRGHGNFPFLAHWTEVADPNAVCFLVPNLVYAWQRHRRRLDPKLGERLRETWPLCAHALNRHRVSWEYSNIFLLSLLSKFLLAPLLPRSDLDADARALWRDWLYSTARYGLTEYNSPTYLPVCLYALERLWAFGPPDLQSQFARVLEYLYFEFAARFHPPSNHLAGAMSRAYPHDLESGCSYAALVAHRQWGAPCRPDSCMIVNWLLSGYVAPATIARIALHKKYPIEIRADTANLGIARADYLTSGFTIGSQTGNYCHPQELPLWITLAGNSGGIHIKPSFPRAARFVSQLRRGELIGIYSYEQTTTRYYYYKRNVRPQGDLPQSLTFEWRLGNRSQVRDVRLNGRRWNGAPRALKRQAMVVVQTGSVSLGLQTRILASRLGSDASGQGLRLAWQAGQLSLLATVCGNAMAHADRGIAGAMAFHLRMSEDATGADGRRGKGAIKAISLRSADQIPIAASSWGVRANTPSPVSVSTLPQPVVHHSSLAEIGPDDLLDFFHGRSAAPWRRNVR